MAARESDANQISSIGVFLVFQNWKGMTMRIVTASVIIAALSLGTPAFVQAQGAPSQSEAQTPPAQASTVIESIQVVAVKDPTPEAASALKAKGLSSSQVVAINLTEGVLTLITKTA